MSAKTEPNPNWVNAPYEVRGWTPERGFFIDRTPPPIRPDGVYWDGKGNSITIKDGKVIIP